MNPGIMTDTISEAKSTFLDAESYENNPDIEKAWANKVVDHMEVHFNLITTVDPKTLKLTVHDDEIYDLFKREFPEFKLDVLEEDTLKSKESKQKWNKFCLQLKDKVQDGTLGTLVRIRSSGAYDEENTIFVVRLQFLAIEIARNRESLNDLVYENHKKRAS